jgi:hypothetical protein
VFDLNGSPPLAYPTLLPPLIEWRDSTSEAGLVDYVEHTVGANTSGLSPSPHPPRYLLLHRALVRRFSSALRPSIPGKNGVQALIDVCADLGIGVVLVPAGPNKVVDFWKGNVLDMHADREGQARSLGNYGWFNSPDRESPCQVYINAAYENVPEGVQYAIPNDPALIGVHDSGLPPRSPLRKHPYKERGGASAKKGRGTCSCALHVLP